MAESTVDILIRVRDAASAELKKLQKEVSKVTDELNELDDTELDQVDDEVEEITEALEDAKDAAEEAAADFNKLRNAGLAIAAIGTAIAAPFFAAAVAAGEFQTAIREISTLVPEAEQSNDQLRSSVLELSNEFGQDRAEIATAMYQAISRGAGAGAEANQLLREALLLARAGVVSVEDATNGLTSVLNAFNLEMSEAAAVSDSMFAAVRGGATTVKELSGFLFQAAPLASALGVSFQELNASIAAITLSGTPTAQAATQIRAALQGLARSTPQTTKALKGYGDVSTAIEEIGLQGTLDLIAEATKGDVGELIKLVGSIEGVQAIMQLTGDTSARFTEQLERQEQSLGATAEAARKVEQSFGVQLEQTTVRLSNAFLELGEAFTPVLVPLVARIGELAVAFSELAQESETAQTVIQVVGVFAALTAAAGVLLTSLAILARGVTFINTIFATTALRASLVAARFGTATIATRVLGVAIRFMLGPIGIAITVITVLAGAFLFFRDDVDEAVVSLNKALTGIDKLNSLERLQFFETATLQVIKLTRAVDDQVAAIDILIAKKQENDGLGFGDRRRLKALQDGLITARAELTAANETAGEFDKSLNDFDIKLVTDDQLQELRQNLADNVLEATALAEELDKVTEAANAKKTTEDVIQEVGGRTSLAGIGIASSGGDFSQEKGEVTKAERANLDALEDEIKAQDAATARQAAFIVEVEKVHQAKRDLKKTNDAIEAKRKKDAENALTDTEKLKKVTDQQTLNRTVDRGAAIADKVVLDEILAANQLLTEQLEADFRTRDITAEEYYAGLSKIAQDNSDAEVALAEATLVRIAGARADALAVAAADDRSPVLVQAVEADFAAQKASVEAGIEGIKTSTAEGIRGIALEASLAGAEGVSEAITILLADLDTGLANIEAKRLAGLITNLEAAQRVASLNAQINAGLERQLDLLIALGAENSDDPAIIADLERVKQALADTNASVNVFASQLQVATEGALTEFFNDTLKNLDNVGEAFENLVQNIGDSIRQLIAERLAAKLTEALFGNLFGGGDGGGGGILSFLGPKEGGLVAKGGGFVVAKQGGVIEGPRTYTHAKSGGVVSANSGGFVVAKAGGLLEAQEDVIYTKAKSGGLMKRVSAKTGSSTRSVSVPPIQLRLGGQPSVGGRVQGRGTETSDSIPAMLSKGEYVVKARSVRQYGVEMLEAINQGVAEPIISRRRVTVHKAQKKRTAFAEGGAVGSAPTAESIGGALAGSGGEGGGGGGSMKLEVSEGALNLTMRDFLEQEFGRIMSTR